MNTEQVLDRFRETLGGRLVFGDAITQGDAVVIPAARVRGGGGGGQGGEGQQQGTGSGFGLSASPVGAFVIRGGNVIWRPAVNVNRIIAGAQIVAGLAIVLLGRTVAKRIVRRRRFRF